MTHIVKTDREQGYFVVLDEGYWLEALHATYMTSSIFDSHVLAHPAVAQTAELKEKAETISLMIGELYQLVGARTG